MSRLGTFGHVPQSRMPCPSDFLPDDGEDFADLIEAEWTGMEADGPLWVLEAFTELVGADRKEVNVARLCTPELDTHGMAPGALLQVLFSRQHVADADMLAAAKALREMLQAYGDGEAERRANHTITMAREARGWDE